MANYYMQSTDFFGVKSRAAHLSAQPLRWGECIVQARPYEMEVRFPMTAADNSSPGHTLVWGVFQS